MTGSPGSELTAPVLVGREREQATLRAALDAARAGQGGLVLLGGAAGIGKTALAELICREATARGATVLIGRAYDLSETPPYGPWVELFARASLAVDRALLPAPLGSGPSANQMALAAKLHDALVACSAQRPLVLFLDDLHWADPASLDLLHLVARWLADLPILLLVAYRADEVGRHHPLYALLPLLARATHALRLDLHPLADADISALLDGRYTLAASDARRLRAYLRDHADGNPFYTGELLRALEEEGYVRRIGAAWSVGDLATARVPALLRQVIEGRVARLGEGIRALLAVAAVIGQEVPLELWGAVAEVGEETLLDAAERAIEARILLDGVDGTAVRFAHALIRETLYEGVLSPRRRVWHRRAGEALLAMPHPDPDAVAYQLREAGDPRAVTWVVRAGMRAQRDAAWLSASARYTTAAALLAGHDDRARERGWLLFASGQLLYFADNAGSLRALDEAEPLALAAGDPALMAHIRFNRGRIRCLNGGMRRGLAEMSEAVIALDALPSEDRLQSSSNLALATIEALFLAGTRRTRPRAPSSPTPGQVPLTLPRANFLNWLALAGRYREALALDEALITPLLTALGGEHTPSAAAAAHLGRGHVHAALGRPDAARHEHELAVAAHRATVDPFMVQYTLWVELLLVIIPYQTDDLAGRARLATEGVHAWERAGGTITTATHAAQSDLPLALLEGRWAEARRLALAGLSATIVGFFQGAMVALGLLARWQGEPDPAWEQVRALLPAGPATAPGDCFFPHGIAMLALAADLALDAGDMDAAGAWVEAHGRWLDWSGATLWRADNLLLRARHARASGDPARSRSYAASALARASTPRQPLALLAAHRALGELDTAADRHADAATGLDTALALAEACAAPYERALTLLALAELHWATGQIAASRAALAAARGLLLPLDARPALARADALAARLAFIRPAPHPAGLTEREVAVLRRVADGLSNRETAAALALSERTVERHLENLYRKIAARNRAEAVAYAIRHKLT